MLYDRTIARVLLYAVTICYIYYVLWMVITPFVDPSHSTQDLFPPREYGIFIASFIMTASLGLAMTVASIHTIRRTGIRKDANKKAK
uniref:Dolichol phosphate-mannose biosynthesis regulatory protein n=1 Tax=Trypanosoma vivax (strain Y486) TaxID=1055687 RepID=G0U2B8_TRYVY|nr:conserved hypothetical protein [Trypanosoma vivax Y486]